MSLVTTPSPEVHRHSLRWTTPRCEPNCIMNDVDEARETTKMFGKVSQTADDTITERGFEENRKLAGVIRLA